MPKDHFVPQFLLREWAPNGNMVSYERNAYSGHVDEKTNAGPGNNCAQKGLNDLLGVPPKQRRVFDDYLTNKIDTPSADAAKKMHHGDIHSLTQTDRVTWAKFLIALPLRTPEVLQWLGPAEALKALRSVESFGSSSPQENAFANTVLRRSQRMYQRNWPRQIAQELIEAPSHFQTVYGMRWQRRSLRDRRLLIGDRPLLIHPKTTGWNIGIPIDSPQCRIALPLAPDAVFLAAFNDSVLEDLEDLSDERLANMLNEETIANRSNKVFASDTSLALFVKKRLVYPSHARVGG